jgi:phosphoribosyl-ATP pyrophosphohydrolase/phosphoribosyl-AMP cyclohydrolase
MINADQLDFSKLGGLIPAVVVDINTDKVLMLAFMNKEALKVTQEKKLVTFFSRTKQKLWTKGETSGNFLELVKILSDCDNDSILVYANPKGNTCHTGKYSCFDVNGSDSIKFLTDLFELIKDRKINLPEKSYTTILFKSGENRIIQKVGEEAIETIVAAKNNDKKEIIDEVSDLLYHLFVMLAEKNIELTEVVQNLVQRHKK